MCNCWSHLTDQNVAPSFQMLPVQGVIRLSNVIFFQEGDQLWRTASGLIMTEQPNYKKCADPLRCCRLQQAIGAASEGGG